MLKLTRALITLAAAAVLLSGCVVGYTLVPGASQVAVSQGSMKVRPPTNWNKEPTGTLDTPRVEVWTQNGPLLDNIRFVGALPSGEAMTRQKPKDDRQVPVFRSDMSPQDLVSMVESFYRLRVGATIFETTSVKPATFAGNSGIQFDYRYVAADEVKRRGRAILSVVTGKLYLISLDGAAVHYFDADVADFEKIVESAAIS